MGTDVGALQTQVLIFTLQQPFFTKMLSLRDFFHLPEVDPIIDQITQQDSGLILVTGMDRREHVQPHNPARFLPSGRAAIFRILIRQILDENPQLQATVVARNRTAFRAPRNLQRRVGFEMVDAQKSYGALIPAITHLRSGLLVVDQLTAKNAEVVLKAAQQGAWVISQMDTVFRGSEVLRALLEWGIPRGRLSGIRWIITMQRLPMLCTCKTPMPADKSLVDAIQQRYPFLNVGEGDFCVSGGCETCEYSGRHNEITAYDFFLADPDQPFNQPSLLPLEKYMLGLAQQGWIPLTDLLRIESDQLHRTYNLLTASEQVLAETQTTLERKIVELEAANRVLSNRTEELVSLQEIGQVLIGSSTLRDLAVKVCRQASQLCGADRAVFYFLGDNEYADVLASLGWAPGRVPQRILAREICNPSEEPAPSPYNHWPPGVESRHPDVEGARLRAGLRVPLIAQGKTVGAMLVHSTSHPHFHPGAMALLQTFANQAAIAIQRAGLIENLQEKIRQLEAAQEGLAQKERMVRELELAREVQQAVLPHTFPKIPGYRFAARNQPARQVGGDFYDVINLGQGRFGLVVADVSDKGMPAAVYMALTRSLIVAEARRADSPVEVLQNVNELLRELGRARMFVTVFYGIVDGSNQQFTFARAGHDRPLLLRDGNILELTGEGVFLGFLGSEHLHLTEESIKLAPNDRLILYTDGLTDTISPEGNRFDRTGLHALLKQIGHLPADQLCEGVFDTLLDYQGEAEQFDDMTLLVVEVSQERFGKPNITFSSMTELAAREVVTWQYEPPYDIYNLDASDEAIDYVIDPENNFFILQNEADGLVGFCSFGKDGQVPGGDYSMEALDIGLGIRPDLTGQGRGLEWVDAVLEYAQLQFNPPAFRVTVATFNQRAQHVWKKSGFTPIQTFLSEANNLEFLIMQKDSTKGALFDAQPISTLSS